MKLPVKLRRGMRRALWTLFALYLTACLGCAAFQRRMLYYPTAESSGAYDRIGNLHGLARWENHAGQNIGWKRKAVGPARAEVLITHGNGGCAADRAEFAEPLRSMAAMDVFVLEYPGYGDRPGVPSQSALFAAAEDAFQSLPQGLPVYLIGESLGTGVAAHLAGAHPEIAGVLLFAPYNSLVDLAQHHVVILPASLILRDRFESEKYLKEYPGPLAIIVGGRDQVVPEQFGRRLFDRFNGPKQIWEAPQAGHNDIHAQSGAYWSEVIAFWRANSRRVGRDSVAP